MTEETHTTIERVGETFVQHPQGKSGVEVTPADSPQRVHPDNSAQARLVPDTTDRAERVSVPSSTAERTESMQNSPVDSSHEPEPEQVLVVVHPAMFGNHPFTFLLYCLLIGGGLLGAMVAGAAGGWGVAAVSAVVAAVGAVLWGWWFLMVRFQVLTVTEKRTIFRTGILSKSTNEVQHDDVRNIQMNQSFFQRLINVGDVAISSSGQDEMEIDVHGVSNASGVVEIIRRYQ